MTILNIIHITFLKCVRNVKCINLYRTLINVTNFQFLYFITSVTTFPIQTDQLRSKESTRSESKRKET